MRQYKRSRFVYFRSLLTLQGLLSFQGHQEAAAKEAAAKAGIMGKKKRAEGPYEEPLFVPKKPKVSATNKT